MTGKEAMKFAMAERHMTQQAVADKAGYARQTNVSEVLRVENARVDSLVRILNACGYDLIMVDREDPEKRYEIEAATK